MVSFLAFLDQHVTVKRLEVVPRDIFQEITIFGAEVADKIVDEHIVSLSSEVREGCVSVYVFHAVSIAFQAGMSRKKSEHLREGAEPCADSDESATNPGEDFTTHVVEDKGEGDEENQANIHFLAFL